MQRRLIEDDIIKEISILSDKVKVLENQVRGLQDLVKEHLLLREECPHTRRL